MDKLIARYDLRRLMAEQDMSMRELTEALKKKYPEDYISVNNLSNKLSKGSLRYCDMVQLADVMGYDVTFTPQKKEKKNDSFRSFLQKMQRAAEIFNDDEDSEYTMEDFIRLMQLQTYMSEAAHSGQETNSSLRKSPSDLMVDFLGNPVNKKVKGRATIKSGEGHVFNVTVAPTKDGKVKVVAPPEGARVTVQRVKKIGPIPVKKEYISEPVKANTTKPKSSGKKKSGRKPVTTS